MKGPSVGCGTLHLYGTIMIAANKGDYIFRRLRCTDSIFLLPMLVKGQHQNDFFNSRQESSCVFEYIILTIAPIPLRILLYVVCICRFA